jgi:hypothetical protein
VTGESDAVRDEPPLFFYFLFCFSRTQAQSGSLSSIWTRISSTCSISYIGQLFTRVPFDSLCLYRNSITYTLISYVDYIHSFSTALQLRHEHLHERRLDESNTSGKQTGVHGNGEGWGLLNLREVGLLGNWDTTGHVGGLVGR